jgi:transcription-repair coupling factor (superfamily II helicase)
MQKYSNELLCISDALKYEAAQIISLFMKNNEIYNLSIPALSLALSIINKKLIVFEEDEESALKLFNGVKSFSEFFNLKDQAVFLQSEGSERYTAVFNILQGKAKKIITTLKASKIDPDFKKLSIYLKKGQNIEREALLNKLIGAGYSHVEMVVQEGEFSHHGWVFDIWVIGEDYPVRVEFFGDEVENIKLFYPDTQRSFKDKEEVWLIPAFESNPDIEITELIGTETVFAVDKSYDSEKFNVIKLSHLPFKFSDKSVDAEDKTFAGLGILPKERKSVANFPVNLKNLNIPVIVVAGSHAQAEILKEILFNNDIVAPVIHKNEVGSYSGKYAVTVSELFAGLYRENIMILTETEIFGEKPLKKKKIPIQKIPVDGLEIKEGDYVVHKEHGIGIFKTIKRQRYEAHEEEVLVLEYKDGDILYVPTWSVDKIYRYSNREGFIPQLDKLGGTRWKKVKELHRKRIHDIADKLLRLYASRKNPRGFVYSEDTEVHKNFDEFFPYEETEDQQKAIEAILKKMREPLPMEVLLCGDAGYGKTEVAMRAAFRAVYDGKQVAVLVPTTLLCEQHYRTFKKRFEAFPVRIEYLSRFRPNREIKKVIEDTKNGRVDILIGTHIMVLKDVEFFDLGLFIIDEEQKFGVIQKEKIKEKYPQVDLLTISATPIPRTLQIGLSGLWDIFVIQSPPKERLAVRTFIINDNDQIIKEAIERELSRGGQIYFLHNRIHDIKLIKTRLLKLLDARIEIAHGRMKERELDRIMLDFLDGRIDILLCTSIIASGLDITNVNTIIINRADMFGLADLYQIRGRVGRASRQAYAYLIIPSEETLTDNAKKRIKAIQEMSYLGAGFHIALKDLEIRGAGELLGVEQSGINRLGFDLYIELLNEAIMESKGEAIISYKLPEVMVSAQALIPEEYIKETSTRIRIYRKLSQIHELSEIQKLYQEISDRFGKMPQEVENIFKIAYIRVYASKIKISKIQQKRNSFRLFFEEGLEEKFVHELINILTTFKKKGIIKELKFYPDGFEIEEKGMDGLILFLKRLIARLEEQK